MDVDLYQPGNGARSDPRLAHRISSGCKLLVAACCPRGHKAALWERIYPQGATVHLLLLLPELALDSNLLVGFLT
jgi:hypothetical protein